MLLIAAALRGGFAVAWETRLADDVRFYFPDSESYWSLARSIARGEAYVFGEPPRYVFRAPGYPLLLAGYFRVSAGEPPVLAARMLSVVCGTLAVAGTYWLASLLFNRRAAVLAASISAVYPGAIAVSGFLLTEAPFMAVLPVQLACWYLAVGSTGGGRRSTSWRWGLASGLAGGIATLIRPSWVLATFALAMVQPGRLRDRRRWLLAATALCGMTAAMLPWWLRNYAITGHLVPTTLQVGASLRDGLHDQATGGSDMRGVEIEQQQLFEFFRTAAAVAGDPDQPLAEVEWEVNQTLARRAARWAGDHPAATLRLAVAKFARTWNVWPNEPGFRRWPVRLVVFASYLPVLIAAAVGCWRSRDQLLAITICLLPAMYFTALHVVFVGSIRYRQPAMLTLAILAATAFLPKLPTASKPTA